MGAALADAARAFPRAQPLVLPGLGADGGGVVDPTQIGGALDRVVRPGRAGGRRGGAGARPAARGAEAADRNGSCRWSSRSR